MLVGLVKDRGIAIKQQKELIDIMIEPFYFKCYNITATFLHAWQINICCLTVLAN